MLPENRDIHSAMMLNGALIKAQIPGWKEPAGLLLFDCKRPDGTSLITWASGKALAWDVTVPDTFIQY